MSPSAALSSAWSFLSVSRVLLARAGCHLCPPCVAKQGPGGGWPSRRGSEGFSRGSEDPQKSHEAAAPPRCSCSQLHSWRTLQDHPVILLRVQCPVSATGPSLQGQLWPLSQMPPPAGRPCTWGLGQDSLGGPAGADAQMPPHPLSPAGGQGTLLRLVREGCTCTHVYRY